MAIEIKLPQWAMTLGEGTIIRWMKKEGDTVEKGEALCEVEEVKVTDVVESSESGVLLKICVAEGETIPVMTTICIIGRPDEEASQL
jgi:pyruvate dehydrogenase E2 component (dihydrolipoamide acetyltransferase)